MQNKNQFITQWQKCRGAKDWLTVPQVDKKKQSFCCCHNNTHGLSLVAIAKRVVHVLVPMQLKLQGEIPIAVNGVQLIKFGWQTSNRKICFDYVPNIYFLFTEFWGGGGGHCMGWHMSVPPIWCPFHNAPQEPQACPDLSWYWVKIPFLQKQFRVSLTLKWVRSFGHGLRIKTDPGLFRVCKIHLIRSE